MQTFLPYADFSSALSCLDYRRLGKQRVEAWQILRIVQGIDANSRWKNHPAVRMWRGFELVLAHYYNLALLEWSRRGFRSIVLQPIPLCEELINEWPPWLGNDELHSSHRANLLRKDFDFYSKFGWLEQPKKGYYWPSCH